MMRLWRDAAVPTLICGCAAFLPVTLVTYFFFVIGYAHFVQGYWYRFRARPIERVYLSIGLLAIVLGFVLYFNLGGTLSGLALVAGLMFSAHFAFDEFFLHGETIQGWRWLTLISFFLLYSSLIPLYSILSGAQIILAFTFLALIGVRVVVAHTSHAEQYLALVGCFIFLLALIGPQGQILGAVILLHAYNWYQYGAERAYSDAHKWAIYWRDVGILIGIFTFGCVLYVTGVTPSLGMLYGAGYYTWTIGHILLSLRVNSFGAWFGLGTKTT